MADVEIRENKPKINRITLIREKKPSIDISLGQTFVGKNYEKLYNKPKINGITLIGDINIADFFSDGLIIDGGNAEMTSA